MQENYTLSFEKWLALTDSFAEDMTNAEYSFFLKGTSMLPFIRGSKDCITVIRTTPDNVRPGDIIMLNVPSGELDYIVHRLIEKKDGFIRTMGDGNTNADPWISEDRILCKIISVKRGKREYPTDGFVMKLYWAIWRTILPARAAWLRIFGQIGTWRKKLR